MSAQKDFFHMNKITIKTGRTAEKNKYNQREGKYATRGDLACRGTANIPDGIGEQEFFEALDRSERKNGGATEYKIALPRGLSGEQQRWLAEDLAINLAARSPVAWAVHCPKAALEGGDQPHLHALISRRVPDGIPRPLDQAFRRHNPKNPERGGWKKDTGGLTFTEVVEKLKAERAIASKLINGHLEKHGFEQRVDHRSHAARGIDNLPSKHLGPRNVWKLRKGVGIDDAPTATV